MLRKSIIGGTISVHEPPGQFLAVHSGGFRTIARRPMPGRPKRLAKKVGEIEAAAVALSADLFALVPAQYQDQPDANSSPLHHAWTIATDAAMRVSIATEQLGDLLREKANIEGPGPARQFLADTPAGEDGVDGGKEPEG